MPTLSVNLELDRCSHCRIDNPNLTRNAQIETKDHRGANKRIWYVYTCSRCGGVVTASSKSHGSPINEYFPNNPTVDESIPDKARNFLKQAYDTIHAPAGCIMLCASSVDAMLKEKEYTDGSLYNRINQAAEEHLITEDMKTWAHEVRLDANDQRHADDDAELPEVEDAKRTLEFTSALAEYLFILPSKVNRGINQATD